MHRFWKQSNLHDKLLRTNKSTFFLISECCHEPGSWNKTSQHKLLETNYIVVNSKYNKQKSPFLVIAVVNLDHNMNIELVLLYYLKVMSCFKSGKKCQISNGKINSRFNDVRRHLHAHVLVNHVCKERVFVHY